MLAAVQKGDAKKVAVLMGQDPGFDVNMTVDRNRNTLLHYACCEERDKPLVILLLLAHPDIDVNAKNEFGSTPFSCACSGHTSCVRELLKDSRVNVHLQITLLSKR